MTQELLAFICDYEDEADFTYSKVTDLDITDAQNKLNVKIPNSFITFLKKWIWWHWWSRNFRNWLKR